MRHSVVVRLSASIRSVVHILIHWFCSIRICFHFAHSVIALVGMDITEVNVLCITALHISTLLRDLSVDCAAVSSSLTHTCERFAVARK